MGPALVRDKRSKQIRWHHSPLLPTTLLVIYEIFSAPPGCKNFPLTLEKCCITLVSSSQLASSPGMMLFASSLLGGPGVLQAACRPSQEQQEGQGKGFPSISSMCTRKQTEFCRRRGPLCPIPCCSQGKAELLPLDQLLLIFQIKLSLQLDGASAESVCTEALLRRELFLTPFPTQGVC